MMHRCECEYADQHQFFRVQTINPTYFLASTYQVRHCGTVDWVPDSIWGNACFTRTGALLRLDYVTFGQGEEAFRGSALHESPLFQRQLRILVSVGAN